MYSVGVTGSREFYDWKILYYTLNAIQDHCIYESVDWCLKVGDCPTGADKYAAQWAFSKRLDEDHFKVFKAKWKKYGKAAGPIRNREMIDDGVDTLLSFPTDTSVGTIHCSDYAASKSIPIYFPELDYIDEHFPGVTPDWADWAAEIRCPMNIPIERLT